MAPPNPTSVYALEPGVVYIVTKRFDDYHAGKFEAGELLTFENRHFLPYHGGHTIVFREKALYLQESDQAEILDNLTDYLAVYDASGRQPPPPPPPPPKKGSYLLEFLGSLCMTAATIAVWILNGRTGFMFWISLLIFGAAAVFSGTDWWRSRRK